MKSFVEPFLEMAKDQPIEALVQLCQSVERHWYQQSSLDWTEDELDPLMEAVAFVRALISANNLPDENTAPELSGDIQEDCSKMWAFLRATLATFQKMATQSKFELYTSRFHNSFASGFVYEFTDGDINRLQELINELREYIRDSNLFSEDHQRRLLKRLESLQSELHKRVSDIDRIWGLVGDAGVVLGKFGNDAKPFVARIKEIAQIGWRTQARAEELPSDCQNPLLEHHEG
jgi:hypothetical protein